MEWKYLAGFTDGEGCFSLGNHNSQMILTLTQTEDRAVVLDVIADFFDSQKISYSWYHGKGNDHTRPYWTLTVSAQKSLQTVVVRMLPYLIVKRPDAEATLEFLRLKNDARMRRQERCKYGHRRTKKNTVIYNGKKSCLDCRKIRSTAAYRRGEVEMSIPGYAAPQ